MSDATETQTPAAAERPRLETMTVNDARLSAAQVAALEQFGEHWKIPAPRTHSWTLLSLARRGLLEYRRNRRIPPRLAFGMPYNSCAFQWRKFGIRNARQLTHRNNTDAKRAFPVARG